MDLGEVLQQAMCGMIILYLIEQLGAYSMHIIQFRLFLAKLLGFLS